MNNKKDILPMVIAAVIALLITGIVRWFLPFSSQSVKQESSKNEVSMPEIPLMVKVEKKKNMEHQVLITSRDIKKDEKITPGHFVWKKWPADAIQSYFIAKDEKDIPLNNGADYNNALKMWAKTDIPKDIPLTMAMLIAENPTKKAEEEKKRKEEDARKRLEKEKSESFIKKGMRAVTFAIDQKSASSSNMLEPGDLVDVLIMEQGASNKSKVHKYKALKILAIDGVTKFESNKKKTESSGLLGGVNLGVSSFLSPKNVTLEVKEKLVETMLKQANTSGVILSLRSQTESADNNSEDESDDAEETSNIILDGILSINKSNPTDAVLEEKARKEAEEHSMSMLMNNINMVNSAESMYESNNKKNVQNSKGGKASTAKSKDGKYEIVSGKIVGEEPNEDPKTVTVYRKLTPTAVKFDEEGKIVNDNSSSSGSSKSTGH